MAKGVPSLAHEARMFDKMNHPDSGVRRLVSVYVGDFAAAKSRAKKSVTPNNKKTKR
ncbi:MAG: hypothetical protein AAB442_02785 [Patescibacteria group bacterium]